MAWEGGPQGRITGVEFPELFVSGEGLSGDSASSTEGQSYFSCIPALRHSFLSTLFCLLRLFGSLQQETRRRSNTQDPPAQMRQEPGTPREVKIAAIRGWETGLGSFLCCPGRPWGGERASLPGAAWRSEWPGHPLGPPHQPGGPMQLPFRAPAVVLYRSPGIRYSAV